MPSGANMVNRWPASTSTHRNCNRPMENNSTGGAWVCGACRAARRSARCGADVLAGLVGVEEQIHRQAAACRARTAPARRSARACRPRRTCCPARASALRGCTSPRARAGGGVDKQGLGQLAVAISASPLEVGPQLAHQFAASSARRPSASTRRPGSRRRPIGVGPHGVTADGDTGHCGFCGPGCGRWVRPA